MKILIVGALSAYAIERFYLKHLNEYADTHAEIFTAQNIFLEYYQKNIFNKIIFRLGYQAIYSKINKQLKEKIQSFAPDILFLFKGMEVFPETIIWAKNRGIKVVNYNPDNPFIFTGRGSGNSNITRSIGLYDLHLTYNREIQEQIEQNYSIPTVYLPFGFELSDELYHTCTQQKEMVKVCFLGNPDKQRARFIATLLNQGVAIDVYGFKWDKYINHELCTTFPGVYGEDYWKVLYRYRVQLNIMRIHNENSHNMRSFEVPGVGGIMLAPRTKEHQNFFIQNKEIFMYENAEECSRIALELLKAESSQISQIRQFARLKSEQAGFSYKDRTGIVFQTLSKLLKQ